MSTNGQLQSESEHPRQHQIETVLAAIETLDVTHLPEPADEDVAGIGRCRSVIQAATQLLDDTDVVKTLLKLYEPELEFTVCRVLNRFLNEMDRLRASLPASELGLLTSVSELHGHTKELARQEENAARTNIRLHIARTVTAVKGSIADGATAGVLAAETGWKRSVEWTLKHLTKRNGLILILILVDFAVGFIAGWNYGC